MSAQSFRPSNALSFTSLFEKCPEAKVLFGFPIDIDVQSPDLLESRRFLAHAAYLLEMIDTALGLLGPDSELLTEIMAELGVKHIKYGVTPEMFPIMGDALLHTFKETLGKKLTPAAEESWKITYEALSADLIQAQKDHKKK